MADQTATTSGEEHVASPPKVSKAKEIPSQKAAPKPVDNQSATKAMASDSDMDVEDYYMLKMPMRVLLPNMCLHKLHI